MHVSSKISKTVIKSHILPTKCIVISVDNGRNVNLLLISMYIENTNEVPGKNSGFAILKSNAFRNKFYVKNL